MLQVFEFKRVLIEIYREPLSIVQLVNHFNKGSGFQQILLYLMLKAQHDLDEEFCIDI